MADRMRSRRARALWLVRPGLLGLAVWSAWGASAARADISFLDMFRSAAYVQTGDGPALTSSGFFLSTALFSTGVDEFDTVVMTYPGPGSPVNLFQTGPDVYFFQTGLIPTQAQMDAEFPTGTYSFDASGPGGSDAASFDYTADAYPQSLPYLTGTDFTDLQGMNPSAPFTVHFSPFDTGSGATASFLFFTIFDTVTSSLVFNAAFLPPDTASLTIPGGTLVGNRSYIYELIFSNRVQVPSPGAVFDAQLGFDLRTTGRFTTAAVVPEPATLAMLVPAVATLGGYALRRRART